MSAEQEVKTPILTPLDSPLRTVSEETPEKKRKEIHGNPFVPITSPDGGIAEIMSNSNQGIPSHQDPQNDKTSAVVFSLKCRFGWECGKDGKERSEPFRSSRNASRPGRLGRCGIRKKTTLSFLIFHGGKSL